MYTPNPYCLLGTQSDRALSLSSHGWVGVKVRRLMTVLCDGQCVRGSPGDDAMMVMMVMMAVIMVKVMVMVLMMVMTMMAMIMMVDGDDDGKDDDDVDGGDKTPFLWTH